MTMVRLRRRWGAFWGWLVGISILAVGAGGWAALVGEESRLTPLLMQLIEPLHSRGIDVVGGETKVVPLGTRPRVAELAGMPLPDQSDWKAARWMKSFVRGATRHLAAVQT